VTYPHSHTLWSNILSTLLACVSHYCSNLLFQNTNCFLTRTCGTNDEDDADSDVVGVSSGRLTSVTHFPFILRSIQVTRTAERGSTTVRIDPESSFTFQLYSILPVLSDISGEIVFLSSMACSTEILGLFKFQSKTAAVRPDPDFPDI